MPVDQQRTNFVIQELTRRSEDVTKRLRDIEQRLDTLEERFSVIEELDIEKNKKNEKRFEDVLGNIKSINDELVKLKLLTEKLNKQSDKYARKTELTEIETALGIIKPSIKKQPIAV